MTKRLIKFLHVYSPSDSKFGWDDTWALLLLIQTCVGKNLRGTTQKLRKNDIVKNQ